MFELPRACERVRFSRDQVYGPGSLEPHFSASAGSESQQKELGCPGHVRLYPLCEVCACSRGVGTTPAADPI
eukprot:s2389_g7.t1